MEFHILLLPIICNTVIACSPFVDSSIFAADKSPRAHNYFSVLFSSFIALYHVVQNTPTPFAEL